MPCLGNWYLGSQFGNCGRTQSYLHVHFKLSLVGPLVVGLGRGGKGEDGREERRGRNTSECTCVPSAFTLSWILMTENQIVWGKYRASS